MCRNMRYESMENDEGKMRARVESANTMREKLDGTSVGTNGENVDGFWALINARLLFRQGPRWSDLQPSPCERKEVLAGKLLPLYNLPCVAIEQADALAPACRHQIRRLWI